MKYDLIASDLVKEFYAIIENYQYDFFDNANDVPKKKAQKKISILVLENEIEEIKTKLFKHASYLNYQLIWESKISNIESFIFTKIINKNIHSLKVCLHKKQKNNSNVYIFKKYLKNLKNKIFCSNNSGKLIIFSGPDGAGKSSLIEDINSLFCNMGITENIIPHHFLTRNTPSIHNLFFIPKKHSNQDYTKPYYQKPAGPISSFIRLKYYFCAFIFDFYFFINKELRSGNIVFFDRYFTDMIVDPVRMKISTNKYYVRFLFKRIFFPDYIFFILANPTNVHLRKPELTIDKIEDLNKEYQVLDDSIENSEIFFNDDEIEISKANLYQRIFNMLEIANKKI